MALHDLFKTQESLKQHTIKQIDTLKFITRDDVGGARKPSETLKRKFHKIFVKTI